MTVDVVEEDEEGRADWGKVVRSDRVCAGATGRKEGGRMDYSEKGEWKMGVEES